VGVVIVGVSDGSGKLKDIDRFPADVEVETVLDSHVGNGVCIVENFAPPELMDEIYAEVEPYLHLGARDEHLGCVNDLGQFLGC
jgi:hypothetical protein